MALITPVIADGAVLSYSTTSGGTYTAFAKIEEITGNKITAAKIETTKLDDVAVTRQAGMPDYGDIELKIRYSPTIKATILGWMNSKTTMYFKLVVQDGTTTQSSDVIAGFVSSFDHVGTLTNNKEVISAITISTSGATTFTSGT